ncbi:MAG TPA: hypothetical protein VKC64_00820 [Burkholderiales bacterium]|nr:hypothetical protein [Burkholderiales bacterium]
MHRLLLLIALPLAAISACRPSPPAVTVSVAPGFYPSAIAHDPLHDRFFIGSHSSGAVALMREDGTAVATVRSEAASSPVVQLAFDPRERQLWVLTPTAVERVDPGAAPVRRMPLAARPGGRFADLAIDGRGRAFVLDGASREILLVDGGRRTSRVVARLEAEGASEAGGAVLLLPDRSALLVAWNAGLWRVEPASGAVEPVPLAPRLADVSQLVLLASDGTAHHVAALRGHANEVVMLRIALDGRQALVDTGTRARFDTPFRGAFDGRRLVVLLGRLRHHPSLGGDGRPNLPPRLATYAPPLPRAVIAVSAR